MNKILKLKLRSGVNAYPVKEGAPRLCLGVEAGPTVVLLVDPGTRPEPCLLTVVKAGDNVAEPAGAYLGSVKGSYVFSDCFAGS